MPSLLFGNQDGYRAKLRVSGSMTFLTVWFYEPLPVVVLIKRDFGIM